MVVGFGLFPPDVAADPRVLVGVEGFVGERGIGQTAPGSVHGIVGSKTGDKRMPLPTFVHLWFWGFTVIFAGIGAYFGAYLKRKGENLAMHGELDKLIVQMQATTEATKAIEARILGQLWDRQKQWELTRDVAIRLIEAQCQLDDAGDEIARIESRMRRREIINSPTLFETDAALDQWRTAHRNMADAIGFANFICWTKEVSDAIAEYNFLLENLRNVPREELFHKIVSSASANGFAFCALRNAIRNELRLQEKEPSSYLLSMPRSSGSASPTPDLRGSS